MPVSVAAAISSVEAGRLAELKLERIDGSERRERSEGGREANIPNLKGVLFHAVRSPSCKSSVHSELQRTGIVSPNLDENLAVFDQQFADAKIGKVREIFGRRPGWLLRESTVRRPSTPPV